MRIRDQWRTGTPRSLGDKANVLGYIIWQLGLACARNLHQERFNFDSDEQRLGVIREYLVYLCHQADRYCHGRLSEAQRQEFVSALVKETARHVQRNSEDAFGAGDHGAGYLELVNARFSQYAGCEFEDELPAYAARRLLGNEIQRIMGDSQTNKWVIQQVLDIDAPEVSEKLHASLVKVMGESGSADLDDQADQTTPAAN